MRGRGGEGKERGEEIKVGKKEGRRSVRNDRRGGVEKEKENREKDIMLQREAKG